MKATVLVSFLLLFMSGMAGAEGPEPGEELERHLSKGQMEKAREGIEALRIWRLTKALDLDEKTTAQLFPLLNRFDKRRGEIERALSDDMRELRRLVRERREGPLKKVLESVEQRHRALQALNDDERAELKRILSVEQQAKYVLFHQEFSRDIRRIIDEARDKRLERPGRPPLPERP